MRPLILRGHRMPITDLKFNKDNDLLFSASKDRYITLWSSEYGERIGTYVHDAAVNSIDVSNDSNYLISGDSTGNLYLWETSTGKLINKFPRKQISSLHSVNFDTTNDYISVAFGGRGAEDNGYIEIYKFKDLLSFNSEKKDKKPEPFHSILIPNKDKITKTKWCDLSKVIVAASEKGILYKYQVDNGELLLNEKVHDGEIMNIDLSPKEELLLTASKDGKAKVIDPDSFEVVSTMYPQNPTRNINACVFSPFISEEDEKNVKYHAFIAGGQEARDVTTTKTKKGGFDLLIYDCMFGEELGAIQGHFGPVNALAITSDGKIFASGSEEALVRVHKILNDEYKALERK